MEIDQFDQLTTIIGQTQGRRAALRLLSAALLGAGGLAALGAGADAKRKRRHRRHHGHGSVGGNGGTTCTPPCDPDQTCQNGTCVGGNVGGSGDDCNPPCGANHVCQQGTCVCIPQCQGRNCGPDGCGGTCGGACGTPTCQGTTLTTQSCDTGVCTPHVSSCAAGQVCFQNACCTRQPRPTCNTVPISDGCGGIYQPNCTDFCCDGRHGELVCQRLACP